MVQTGESVNQAKVFRAHAVLQGLRGNLINALKLLANQQEDGNGLIQNIVTNFSERSRSGVTEGLREFVQVDNHRPMEVGHLSEGLGTFRVRRPKGSEGYPEVTVELNASSRGMGTWKSYINVDHITKERWCPLLVDTDWHAFCQALFYGIGGEGCGEQYDAHKDMSRAVGAQEHQKPKDLWKMKTAKDATQEKNTTIPRVKTTSWEETRQY